MRNELINKIDKILDEYTKNKAKTWEIGTNFYQSWKILSKKLKNVNTEDILPTKIKIEVVENERYRMIFGGKNITPASKKEIVAESTIRQYLQVGSALSYINYSEGDPICGYEFSVKPSIWDLRDNPNLLIESLFRTLIKSVSSNIYYEINLGYSLFLCIIQEYDDAIFNDLKSHEIWPITNSKVWSLFLPMNTKRLSEKYNIFEYIKKLKGERTKILPKNHDGKNTYVEACKILIKTCGFEHIVDKMYEYINNPKLDEFNIIDVDNQNIKSLINIVYREIDSRRSKLRGNIIKERVHGENKYSDLNNDITNIGLCEGCHIYDVWRIKDEVKKYINEKQTKEGTEKFVQEVDDFNNGILLTGTCHKMFDDEIVWFDTNGNLCYRSEHKNDVKQHFGKLDVRIKDTTLTKEMKKYLTKRV